MNMNGMDALRTAAPYLNQFREQIFVIKLGGEVVEDPASLRSVAEQIGLLWRLGIYVVVVHGGGSAMDALSDRLGLKVEKVAGRRVTDADALEAATMTLAGSVHMEVLSAFRALDLPVVGLSGLDAGLLQSTKRPPISIKDDSGADRVVDFGFVGDIDVVDAHVIDHLLEGGFLPVVSPVTGTSDGQPLNTNADSVAAALAIALEAEKLIFVLSVPGILRDKDDHRSLIPVMSVQDLDAAIEQGTVSGGMLPKLNAVKEALAYGTHAVHLVGSKLADAILIEVFTNEGAGTMIEGDDSFEA